MAPIRVGILGLSVSTGGTSWAKNAHLEYLKASPKYELIAICNSSAESAQKAIKEFGLGPDAKAYGSPEDLAKDPHVDLVVCSTRVDRHYEGIMPAIKAGKDVFCEWPLCANRKQAEEVTKLAKEKGIRTMVGLQAQVSPFVNKVKDLIAQGKIGDVLSSTWIGSPGNGGEEEGTGVAYFTDREVGGNMLTIQFAHSFDAVLHALGEMESFNSLLAVQRKTTNIIDRQANNKIVEKDKPKNTFDQAIIQGQLQSSQTTKPLLSYHMRGGKPFPGPQGDPKLIWRIYGTKGEIQFTGPTCSLNVGYEEGFKIDVVDSSGKVVNVEVPKDDFLDGLSVPGRNISRLYEAFADGKSGYPDWNDALKRHRMLDEMERRADSGSQLLGAEYLKL